MAAVTQYEHDWRTQKLLAQPPTVSTPLIIGVAKSGWVFSGGSDISIQPYTGDPGASLGLPLPLNARATRITVAIVSNTLSGPAELRVMKNEADTELTLTVPAGETGVFSATGDVSFAAGDRIQIHLVAGGLDTESIDVAGISILLFSE